MYVWLGGSRELVEGADMRQAAFPALQRSQYSLGGLQIRRLPEMVNEDSILVSWTQNPVRRAALPRIHPAADQQ